MLCKYFFCKVSKYKTKKKKNWNLQPFLFYFSHDFQTYRTYFISTRRDGKVDWSFYENSRFVTGIVSDNIVESKRVPLPHTWRGSFCLYAVGKKKKKKQFQKLLTEKTRAYSSLCTHADGTYGLRAARLNVTRERWPVLKGLVQVNWYAQLAFAFSATRVRRGMKIVRTLYTDLETRETVGKKTALGSSDGGGTRITIYPLWSFGLESVSFSLFPSHIPPST